MIPTIEGDVPPQGTYDYDPKHKKLTVRQAAVFPREIFEYADEVEVLDMSFGHLKSLPDDFGRFKNMRIAFLSNHDFEEVPPVLSTCESLEMVGFKSCKISTLPDQALPAGIRGVILTDNQLSSLPASIGEYSKLQKLMLAGNQIQALPPEIVGCQNLELLRIPINGLSKSPDWLFQLPKLAWYTDAGNPFHGADRTHAQGLRELSWMDLELGEKIGESAKNTVYRARLASGEEVAVKVFGKGITTDGLPIDDINACLRAGDHANIIGGMGRLVDIPEGAEGLVMPLVPPEFKSLGYPPDLQTLTRDVYPHIQELSPAFILRVLRDISSALEYCHAQGVMHGDVYAHNILVDAQGQSFLGDFGAASLYTPNSREGRLREQVEVRGFGYLIDDLVSKWKKGEAPASFQKIQALRGQCLGDVSKGPTFAEIRSLLAA